jgi:hypothetical protein
MKSKNDSIIINNDSINTNSNLDYLIKNNIKDNYNS